MIRLISELYPPRYHSVSVLWITKRTSFFFFSLFFSCMWDDWKRANKPLTMMCVSMIEIDYQWRINFYALGATNSLSLYCPKSAPKLRAYLASPDPQHKQSTLIQPSQGFLVRQSQSVHTHTNIQPHKYLLYSLRVSHPSTAWGLFGVHADGCSLTGPHVVNWISLNLTWQGNRLAQPPVDLRGFLSSLARSNWRCWGCDLIKN